MAVKEITLREKINTLKESGQDFEWYPTTNEMILNISTHCGQIASFLDIGAGDGRVLEAIDRLNFERFWVKGENKKFHSTIKKYAIEKSTIHIEKMPPDISIIGTDFMRQTLIDKSVDIVFCNPPYSQYESWATKIIKEANAQTIFLILPQRWDESKLIKRAIEQREACSSVIWSGDFSDADRQARAKVDIIKIVISCDKWGQEKSDPFDVWFDEYFSGFDRLKLVEEQEEDQAYNKEPIVDRGALVEGQNLIERLYELYQKELDFLLSNYKSLSVLDVSLLKEIGVSVDDVRGALKLKIEGLKNKYWKELFDHLDKITCRLTSESRDSMLEKLRKSCNIDFSIDNVYAVVLWAIKNSNKYIDQQLVELFRELSRPEHIKNYKSNLKTWEDENWRYKQRHGSKTHTHYMLEYRTIVERYAAIDTSGYRYTGHNGLEKKCHDFINDIFTVANNLGFTNRADSLQRQWKSNNQQSFFSNDGKVLVAVRAFKNGNVHLKFNQEFIKALNVEASRLLGWIKSPQEAADEMGLDIDFVNQRFGSNLLLGVADGQKLLT